jgi:hypothetical protein
MFDNKVIFVLYRQISYGNMIACENPECSIEWFHFACVGLLKEVCCVLNLALAFYEACSP